MPAAKSGKSRKFARPFHGPYRVIELSNNNAKVIPIDQLTDFGHAQLSLVMTFGHRGLGGSRARLHPRVMENQSVVESLQPLPGKIAYALGPTKRVHLA